MLLAIHDNWHDASASHAAYVGQQLAAGTQYFSRRVQMAGAIDALLSALLTTASAAELVTTLDAVTDARKGAVPPGTLPAPLHSSAQYALSQGIAQLPPGLTADDLARHAKKELAEHGNSRRTPAQIRDRLLRYQREHTARSAVDPHTIAFLNAHCQGIGTMDFVQMTTAASAYQASRATLPSKTEQQLFADNLARVFDYDKFCTNGGGWNAYSLCKLSRTRTCPYCNQAYAFTVVRKSGTTGARPTLDHFFPQSVYPLLAISLNNLIPSCYPCNANLKGKADFFSKPHLHPLYDNEAIGFEIEAAGMGRAGLLRLLANPAASKAHARLKVAYDAANHKAANSADTFLLQERYHGHLPEALAFSLLHLTYDKHKVREMRRLFKGLTQAQVLQFDPSRPHHHLLGKMYADLFKQLKR